MYKSKVRFLSANAMIMAVYIVLSLLIAPVSSGIVQFRISESLNHLVVFNRKLMWGVLFGVITFNLFFGFGLLDALFGGAQTAISLSLTALLQKKIKNTRILLGLNTFFFTVTMFIVAFMVVPNGGSAFWVTYASLASSEGIILTLSAPLMYWLNSIVHFDKRVY